MSSTYSPRFPGDMAPPPKPHAPRWSLDVSLKLICPYCREDPANLVEEYASGDTICGSCGLVLGERIIDTRAEWRSFSSDESNKADMNRVGEANDVFHSGTGLDTKVGKGGKEAWAIERAQRKINSATESKNLLKAYSEIEVYCVKNAIQDDVRDVAKMIYKKIDEGMKPKLASHEAVVASCILIACRQCKVDRTFREIFLLTNVPKKEIGRTFKKVEAFLQKEGMKNGGGTSFATVDNDRGGYISTAHTEAGKVMVRFCNLLGFDVKFTAAAEELVKKMSNHSDFCARSPLSIAATAIYTMAKVMRKRVDQIRVAKLIGISTTTIGTGFRSINVNKHSYFDEAWLEKIGGTLDVFPELSQLDIEKYERYEGPGAQRGEKSIKKSY